MITDKTIEEYLRRRLPDAIAVVEDRTGTRDHFRVRVVSSKFEGRDLLDRHRSIYAALAEPMSDGRIHAVEITALTPREMTE